MRVESVYESLSGRMPHHAGVSSGGAVSVPAGTLVDERRLAGQLDACAKLYGRAKPQVLGTIWWYSVSSVLVAPALESLAGTGTALDPALESVRLLQLPDGRLTGARSTSVFGEIAGPAELAELGARMGTALAGPIEVISAQTGAGEPALWAIAADSIANRLLWAEMALAEPVTELAGPLAEAIGKRMPLPRYVDVDSRRFVRRVSCCLIYQATGGQKCVSCPHQHPDERAQRLQEVARTL